MRRQTVARIARYYIDSLSDELTLNNSKYSLAHQNGDREKMNATREERIKIENIMNGFSFLCNDLGLSMELSARTHVATKPRKMAQLQRWLADYYMSIKDMYPIEAASVHEAWQFIEQQLGIRRSSMDPAPTEVYAM